MAPRAYWKGTLKLSLVSCPVALYPATTVVLAVWLLREHTSPLQRVGLALAGGSIVLITM